MWVNFLIGHPTFMSFHFDHPTSIYIQMLTKHQFVIIGRSLISFPLSFARVVAKKTQSSRPRHVSMLVRHCHITGNPMSPQKIHVSFIFLLDHAGLEEQQSG